MQLDNVNAFFLGDVRQVLTIDTTTPALANLPAGYFGFFDTNYNSVNDPTSIACCPLYLASSSVLTNYKIGPFHGGYKETNKSKLIKHRYIQAAYSVEACTPKQAVVSVGATPQTFGPSASTTPDMFQDGTTEATGCFEFLCGETYYLRIDIKGSPALRALNHNAYQTVSAYTGCCAGPTPTVVNSTLVMIEWAKVSAYTGASGM